MVLKSLNLRWDDLKSSVCTYFSAGLLILAFPNFNLSFLIWVGLVPFLLLLDGQSPKAAFFWGWLTGFLFFLGTHYWLIHVTLPGMILVNIYLGLYFGLFGLGFSFFQKLPLKHRLWIFPSLWVALEFARDRLFSGFGWACLGHSQYQFLPLIQIADLTGVFGVSFVIVMVNVLLADVYRKNKVVSVSAFLVAGVVVGVLSYGMYILKLNTSRTGIKIKIALIQPNISQSRKWNPALFPEIQKQNLVLTEEALAFHPDLVIWPETSFPGFLWQNPQRFLEIKDFVARRNVPLLLGAVTMRSGEYYNSALLMTSDGQEGARQDKIHLVPFGEFLPLRPWLNFIENFVPIGDFASGQDLTVFPILSKAHELSNFSVMICFEDTVAHVTRALTGNGAKFLVNITNDGWFKDTNAPYLHLQGSVFQAVANRRAIARAANTGVSGFINTKGKTNLFRDRNGKAVMAQGFMIGEVTGSHESTFYTRWGDVFANLCIFAVGLAVIKRKI